MTDTTTYTYWKNPPGNVDSDPLRADSAKGPMLHVRSPILLSQELSHLACSPLRYPRAFLPIPLICILGYITFHLFDHTRHLLSNLLFFMYKHLAISISLSWITWSCPSSIYSFLACFLSLACYRCYKYLFLVIIWLCLLNCLSGFYIK